MLSEIRAVAADVVTRLKLLVAAEVRAQLAAARDLNVAVQADARPGRGGQPPAAVWSAAPTDGGVLQQDQAVSDPAVIRLGHHRHQPRELDPALPSELLRCLLRLTDQRADLGRPEMSPVDAD